MNLELELRAFLAGMSLALQTVFIIICYVTVWGLFISMKIQGGCLFTSCQISRWLTLSSDYCH